MEVRSDDMMIDIMHAEEVVKISEEEAKKEAEKIVKKATITAEHLREKSLVKIREKQEKLVSEYDKKIASTLENEEANSEAVVSKLHAEVDPKVDKVAQILLKEILSDVGCENE